MHEMDGKKQKTFKNQLNTNNMFSCLLTKTGVAEKEFKVSMVEGLRQTTPLTCLTAAHNTQTEGDGEEDGEQRGGSVA